MRHVRLFLLLALAGSMFGQGTASLSFTQSFTSATTGTAISNGPTPSGGPAGSVGFRMVYYIQPGSGTVSALSIELDGAALSGGSYTALTPAVGGGSGATPSVNPAVTSPEGQNNLCCDFYPFLRLKVNTLTIASGHPILIVKVLGYAGTTAAAGSNSSGGGLTCLNGDVLAGTGSCTPAEVVALENVPFCSGFSPTNGQFLKYTTGGSPNPCYTAAASAITGGTCTSGQFVSSISTAGAITCGVPPGGGTIATTTNALVGDGAGNAAAAGGTGTNCLLVNGGNQACAGGGGGNGLTVYSGLAGIGLSNATLYFPIGGGSLASNTESLVQALMESSGTVGPGFGVSISAALGVTVATNNTAVLTWRKNATGQTITCTITNPATSCSDVTHSFTFVAGDVIDIQVVFVGTITATPVWVLNVPIGSVAPTSGITPNPAASAPTASVPFTGWTLQNVSNAHNSFNDFFPNELVMSSGNFGAQQWGAATRTISVPYTLIATIETRGQINGALSGNGSSGPFNSALCISDGTKYEFLGIYLANVSADIGLAVSTLATLASTASNVAGPTGNVAGLTLSLKITNNGTNRTFFYWASGAWVQFFQETTGTFLSETTAGIVSLNDVGSGGYTIDVAIKYWSVQ